MTVYDNVWMYVFIEHCMIYSTRFVSMGELACWRQEKFPEYVIWKECAKINADVMAQNRWYGWVCLVPDSVQTVSHCITPVTFLPWAAETAEQSCDVKMAGTDWLWRKTKMPTTTFHAREFQRLADCVWMNCYRIVHFGNRRRCPATQLSQGVRTSTSR